MCYFMCIGLSEAVEDIEALFPSEIALQQADEMPIGQAMEQQPDSSVSSSFLITVNGCSCDLFRGGHKMDAQPALLLEGLSKLIDQIGPVAVMVHWFTDYPEKQAVNIQGAKKTTLKQFTKSLAKLDEDTCYQVKA